VVYLERCGSTQDAARELAERGVAEGAVVVAEVQEAGRGRLGRSWHSAAGGIYATVVLRPPPRALRVLSLAASVAVTRVLELLGLDAKVKWPNDVQVSGRKVSGVLVEAAAEPGGVAYALVGIGLNVNNELPPELVGAATTLREAAGQACTPPPPFPQAPRGAGRRLRPGEGGAVGRSSPRVEEQVLDARQNRACRNPGGRVHGS
jgi:BirA family biotin operon repressor/biotin-[acetyl-CoA-carboxylase] ligase